MSNGDEESRNRLLNILGGGTTRPLNLIDLINRATGNVLPRAGQQVSQKVSGITKPVPGAFTDSVNRTQLLAGLAEEFLPPAAANAARQRADEELLKRNEEIRLRKEEARQQREMQPTFADQFSPDARNFLLAMQERNQGVGLGGIDKALGTQLSGRS